MPAFHRRLAEAAGDGYYTVADDERKRRAIAQFERYADRIFYLNPDLGAVPAGARRVHAVRPR